MVDALIGSTGFVGGNLARQTHFDESYNSRNIEAIADRKFGLLVCSGAPAEKWRANQDPVADLANIERLMHCLAKVSADEVVLISTVDVYPDPVAVDEDAIIDPARVHPYGKHRLLLEAFVSARFHTTVVRLPGLFGPGLKKNIVFDLLHGNRVDQVHCDSVFQFYDLNHLWRDISIARQSRLQRVNFATEPTSVREVARAGFGIDFQNRPSTTPARYDFRSRHAALFGGSGEYLYDKQQVLSGLAAFVASARAEP